MPGTRAAEGTRHENALLRAMTDAVGDATRGAGRVAVLFSGGLDSSLLVWLLPPEVPAVLVAIGLAGSPDLVAAQDGAARLARPVETIVLRPEDVDSAWDRWRPELAELREPARSVSVAFTLATEQAPPGRVLCGQGADELFYGYAHFRDLEPAEARQRGAEDLRRLEGTDWPRALRIGRAIGRDLRAPYLDPRVQAAAGEFPPPARGEAPKFTLRRVAALAGLPADLVDRPKRALQYGSGVARRVERIARRGLPPPH